LEAAAEQLFLDKGVKVVEAILHLGLEQENIVYVSSGKGLSRMQKTHIVIGKQGHLLKFSRKEHSDSIYASAT